MEKGVSQNFHAQHVDLIFDMRILPDKKVQLTLRNMFLIMALRQQIIPRWISSFAVSILVRKNEFYRRSGFSKFQACFFSRGKGF